MRYDKDNLSTARLEFRLTNEEMKIFIKDYFGDDMEDIKDVTYEEAD